MAQNERILIKLIDTGELYFNDNWEIMRGFFRWTGGKAKQPKPHTGTGEHIRSGGFKQVHLKTNGKTTSCMSHRLVWQHVYGDIPEGYEIVHLNGIRWDNRPENLKAMAHGNIQKYAQSQIGDYIGTLKGERCSWAKLTKETLEKARVEHLNGKPVSTIAKEMGLASETLNSALTNKTWRGSFASNIKIGRAIKCPPETRQQIISDYYSAPRYQSGKIKYGELKKLAAKHGISTGHMINIAKGIR